MCVRLVQPLESHGDWLIPKEQKAEEIKPGPNITIPSENSDHQITPFFPFGVLTLQEDLEISKDCKC